MKQLGEIELGSINEVAPHTGAWIETPWFPFDNRGGNVAPHTGAWIETGIAMSLSSANSGRTPHGCVD